MAELFRETIKSSFEGRRVVWIDAEDIPRGRRLAPGHGCFQVISTEERSNRLRPGPTGLTTMWSM
jgi:hypothetical protein